MKDLYLMGSSSANQRMKTILLAAVFLTALAALLILLYRRGNDETAEEGGEIEKVAPQEAEASTDPWYHFSGQLAVPVSGRAAVTVREPTRAQQPPASDRGRRLLAEAETLLAEGKLLESREILFTLLDESRDRNAREKAGKHLGEIHIELVFNPHPMPEKEEYTVSSGDSLDRLARRFGTTVELLQKSNRITGHIPGCEGVMCNGCLIRIGQKLRILKGEFSILVDIETNTLTVYLNDRFFKRYPVGTGAYDKTPTGSAKVTDRIRHPPWWRPNGNVIPYGHEDNLLGTHWLALDIPRYGIHGTWEPETIGTYESAGCIRMYNHDVEELFELIAVGTPVEIK